MMSTTDLADVTVERFWKEFNWLGLPPQVEAIEREGQEPTNWLELGVSEFLNRANWSGRRPIESKPTPVRDAPTVTLTVAEYFQSLPWRGGSANVPAPSPTRSPEVKLSPPSSHDFNATDLSNLF